MTEPVKNQPDPEWLEPTFAFPGVGGSLGKCALCGKTFTLELLTNEPIATIRCSLLKDSLPLPMHSACADTVQTVKTWPELPEGPLRTMFERRLERERRAGADCCPKCAGEIVPVAGYDRVECVQCGWHVEGENS